MYTFKDRGDRSLTLRPENTASVVRSYLENAIYGKEDVTKYYYNGSMFRYERPQAGRQREFNQIGVEVLGESSPILDAEVIAMSYSLLEKLGITDLEVHINSVGTNASRTKYREMLLKFLEPMKEELCEDCRMRMEKNPLRVLDCKVDKCKELTKDAPSIIDSLNEEERAHYETVKKYLDIFGVKYVEDSRLVRGLDYYSSTVYEIVTNKLPTFGKHVAVELTGENHRQFFIPRGFAHGFAVLSDEVLFQYKCDHYYAPQSEGGIAWDDPDLGIDWRLPADKVILSDKDKKHPRLKDYQTDFDFNQSLY